MLVEHLDAPCGESMTCGLKRGSKVRVELFRRDFPRHALENGVDDVSLVPCASQEGLDFVFGDWFVSAIPLGDEHGEFDM